MHRIEFLGLPGSRKSTLSHQVEARAAKAGIPVIGLDVATRHAIAASGADPLARFVARTAGRMSHRLWKQTMTRASDRVDTLARAVSARPELVATIITANHVNNQGSDATLVLRWLLSQLIANQLAEETLDADQWLIATEGFANRTISLFATASENETSLLEAARYLGLIPVPDVLVTMSTPLDFCYDQLELKGWTERIADQPPERRRAFLEEAEKLALVAREHLEQAGSRVVVVDGSALTDRSPDLVLEMIRSVARSESKPSGALSLIHI